MNILDSMSITSEPALRFFEKSIVPLHTVPSLALLDKPQACLCQSSTAGDNAVVQASGIRPDLLPLLQAAWHGNGLIHAQHEQDISIPY